MTAPTTTPSDPAPSVPRPLPPPVAPDLEKPAIAQRVHRFRAVTETIVRSPIGSLWLSLKLSALGTPKYVMELPQPTAGVALGAGGEILFVFNPWYFDLSSDRLLRFTILHELYHLLYDHLKRGVELARLREEQIRAGLAYFPFNHELWNIAIDCLDNEKLAEQGILTPGVEEDFRRTAVLVFQHMYPTEPVPDRLLNATEGGVWLLSRALPGFDEPWGTKLQPFRSLWTSERVYELLEAMADKVLFTFESGAVGAPVESTQPVENQGKLPPNTRVVQIPKEVQDRAHELSERARAAAGKPQQGPELDAANGNEPPEVDPAGAGDQRHVGPFQDFKIVRPTRRRSWEMDAANILARQLFPREADQWVKPHKLLSAFYPDVLMANEADTEVETKTIDIFGDCSGSMTSLIPNLIGITEEMLRRFTNWKHRCIVNVYAFDTEIYDWPSALRKRGKAPSNGGTKFQPIADFVEGRRTTSRSSHHPGGTVRPRHADMVVVVTDGEAEIPTLRAPHRWLWVLVAGPNMPVNPRTPNIGRTILYSPSGGSR